MTSKELLNNLIMDFSNLDYILPEDIPNIDLYVDQVTTFMDSHLSDTKRNPEDKILTKTMINNYTKNNVLPSPEKKKYSKDHVLTLIFIYYFKSFLSMEDISRILNPITEKHFNNDNEDMTFSDVYAEIFSLQNQEAKSLIREVYAKYKRCRSTFTDVEDEKEQEELQKFALLSSLAFDVYIKKMMIESIVDYDRNEKEESNKTDEDKSQKKD